MTRDLSVSQHKRNNTELNNTGRATSIYCIMCNRISKPATSFLGGRGCNRYPCYSHWYAMSEGWCGKMPPVSKLTGEQEDRYLVALALSEMDVT